MKLDKKKRCCGKPNLYWVSGGPSHAAPFYLCWRCNRVFDMDGEQRESLVWKKNAIGRYRRRARRVATKEISAK